MADPKAVNDNFEYLDGRITDTAQKIYTNNSSYDSKLAAITTSIAKTTSVTELEGLTPSLLDNSIHNITVIGNTVFTLPVVTDTTKFHQMLVLLNMPEVKTINLGTKFYFNGFVPDMSEAGKYTVIYEYDGTNWVVGVLSKREVT